MQALKNLFGPKFPEYAEFMNALDEIRGYGVEIIDNDTRAFSKSFDNFIKSQIDNSQPLSAIKETSQVRIKSMQHLFNSVTKLQKDFQQIKIANERLQNGQSALNDSNNAAQKAKKEAEKADELLAKARSKGYPAEIAKCEQRADLARNKADIAASRADDEKGRFSQHRDEYSAEFLQTLTKILDAICEEKQKEIAELEPMGEKLKEAVAGIQEYDDEAIKRLEKKLEELDAEVIE